MRLGLFNFMKKKETVNCLKRLFIRHIKYISHDMANPDGMYNNLLLSLHKLGILLSKRTLNYIGHNNIMTVDIIILGRTKY